ncbi:MAG: hypothetical protein AAFR04_16140, partial [Pseudomonadota bacterium]
MSVRAIPTLFIVLFLYNVIALLWPTPTPEEIQALGAGSVADAIFRKALFTIPMFSSGASWTFSWGDLLILLTLIFVEAIYLTGMAPGMEVLLAFAPGGQAELTVL